MDRETDKPTTSEPLWTASQTAATLAVSKSWVYRAHRSGQLPGGVKLSNGTLRFVPEIVMDHVADLAYGSSVASGR